MLIIEKIMASHRLLQRHKVMEIAGKLRLDYMWGKGPLKHFPALFIVTEYRSRHTYVCNSESSAGSISSDVSKRANRSHTLDGDRRIFICHCKQSPTNLKTGNSLCNEKLHIRPATPVPSYLSFSLLAFVGHNLRHVTVVHCHLRGPKQLCRCFIL
jgi:hypothetical protein